MPDSFLHLLCYKTDILQAELVAVNELRLRDLRVLRKDNMRYLFSSFQYGGQGYHRSTGFLLIINHRKTCEEQYLGSLWKRVYKLR